MNLSLQQLQALVAVAEDGSFTGAAHRMHLTQSAVSRTVAQAELALGTPVFVRTTRSLGITDRGRAILPVVRTMLEDFARGSALVEDAARGESEVLSIAALPSVTASILPRAVTAFRARSPRTRVQILTGDASRIGSMLRDGAVNLAITVDQGLGSDAEFTSILDDDFICLHPLDHPFGRMNRLTWRRVAEEPLIALSSSSSVRRGTDEGFAAAGVSPESVTEAADMPTAAALVAAGLGVTVATRLSLPLTAFAALAHTRLTEPTVSRKVGVVVSPAFAPTAATSTLVHALQTEARRIGHAS
ncbi:LysR family transcriptional regulator [soil metagenome]